MLIAATGWNGTAGMAGEPRQRGSETMKSYGFSEELRATGEGSDLILEGRAIVFGQPTVLFEMDGVKYREIISPDALDSADLGDVVLRYNHDKSFTVLARTRNRSMSLERRQDGLYMRARLQSDVQAHVDAYNSVRSGLVDKMSFAFAADEDGVSFDRASHTSTVNRIRKVYDLSIVDQPAYEQTYVAARSRLEEFAQAEGLREATAIRLHLLRRYLLG